MKKNILIIDDEELLLEVLVGILDNFECLTTDRLDNVEDIISRYRLDAILCDIMMPGGGGIELYEKLKAERSPLAERLIFITGGLTNQKSQEFLQTIQLPILYKPFREKDVLRVLSRLDGFDD